MSLVVLIPLSLFMGLVGVGAFVWAMRHDQFEDLEGASWRVLLDAEDDRPLPHHDSAPPAPAQGPAAEASPPPDSR